MVEADMGSIISVVFELVKWFASGGWSALCTTWPHIQIFVAIAFALFGMYFVIRRAICPRIDRLTGIANVISTNHLPHIEARQMEGNQLTRDGHEITRREGQVIREFVQTVSKNGLRALQDDMDKRAVVVEMQAQAREDRGATGKKDGKD